jgi:hypothetical protein
LRDFDQKYELWYICKSLIGGILKKRKKWGQAIEDKGTVLINNRTVTIRFCFGGIGWKRRTLRNGLDPVININLAYTAKLEIQVWP